MSAPFDYSNPPPFTSEEWARAIIALIITECACALNLTALSVAWRIRDRLRGNTSLLMTINVLCVDTIYLNFSHIAYLYKLSKGCYAMGPVGYQVEGVMTMSGALWMYHVLGAIGVQQYLLIVRRKTLSFVFWSRVTVYTLIVPFLLACIPLITPGTGFAIQPSGIYSTANWRGREVSQLVFSCLPLVLGLGVLNLTSTLYMQIFKFVKAHRKETESIIQSKNRSTNDGQSSMGAVRGSRSQIPAVVLSKNDISVGQASQPELHRISQLELKKASQSELNNRLSQLELRKVGPSNSNLPVLGAVPSMSKNSLSASKSALPANSTVVDSDLHRLSEAERRTLKRAAMMFFQLFVAWTPYGINVLLSLCRVPVPPWYDAISLYLPLIGSCNISLCTLYFDTFFERVMREDLRRARTFLYALVGRQHEATVSGSLNRHHLMSLTFNYDDPPPFTPDEHTRVVIALCLTLCSFTLSWTALSTGYRNRNKFRDKTSALMTMNILCIDTIYVNFSHVGWWVKLASNSYAFRHVGCLVEGVMTLCGALWTYHILGAIAVHQYLLIVRRKTYPFAVWFRVAAFTFLFPFALALIPLFVPGTGFALQPSGIYCTVNWRGHQVTQMLFSSMPIVIGVMVLNVTSVLYFQIYRSIQTVRVESDKLQQRHQNTSTAGQSGVVSSVSQVDLSQMSSLSQAKSPKQLAVSKDRLNARGGMTPLGGSMGQSAGKLAAPTITKSMSGLNVTTQTSSTRNLANPSKSSARMTEAERRTLRRMMMMFFQLFIVWLPYGFNVGLSLCQIPVPPWYDAVTLYLPILGSCNISLCTLVLDTTFERTIRSDLARIRNLLLNRRTATTTSTADS
ncbi:hypothetical protein RI367_006535 [Sorochytrium milnesiophthora]